MIRIITLALCLSFASISFVMASNEKYFIAGLGAASCGAWIESRKDEDLQVNVVLGSWVQGFLSGLNVIAMESKREISMIPDPDTLLAYVDKGCEDDPLTSVYKITNMLHGQLQQL